MSQPHDNHQYVRRVVLPSGKTIDVVYFEELREQPEGLAAVSTRTDMHVCGTCHSHFVHPVDWEEAGTTHWEVVLYCPECEWTGTGIFDQASVERFDGELDRGTEALARDLKRLVQANMEYDIERFVNALESDHLVPDDY